MADKIQAASTFEPIELEAVDGARLHVPDSAWAFTHLQFRRFAGCPICNLHLRSFIARRGELEATGVREIIFFHSSADLIREYESQVPFALVADPEMTYYRRYGVESSLQALLNPQALLASLQGLVAGRGRLVRKIENGPTGLPADILVDGAGTVTAVKYGAHAYDQWGVDEVLALTRRPAW